MSASPKIPPTIGRVMLYWPSLEARNEKGAQAMPVLVCYVHSDSMVNVGGFNHNGVAFGVTSVRVVQDGEDYPEKGPFVEWMPYQKGQAAAAAKTEIRSATASVLKPPVA